jgi:lipopolysaccharide transport system ATP-binding protein
MISARNLRKGFRLYKNPAHRLMEAITGQTLHTPYQALDSVSFALESGETLGIIGRNGAGKSTLLKLLSGVLLPDSGQLTIPGKVTGLLELGTGFDASMSGQHNILTNGLLLGMSEADIEKQRQHIIDFAELGQFIDEPLRTYSSGMTMRLAFSIAIHAHPSTFLIDEALSVGDGHFQQKCMRRIREFRASGGSIIFVSHDLNAVKMLCDRVLVLDGGKVVADEAPEHAINVYNRLLAGESAGDLALAGSSSDFGYGDGKVCFTGVEAVGADSGARTVTSGEDLLVTLDIAALESVQALTAGFLIRDRFGQDIFGSNTHLMGLSKSLAAGERSTLQLRVPMHLHPGKYTLTLSLHDGADHTERCFQWWDNAVRFEVSGIRGAPFIGVCNLRPGVEGW